MTIYTIELAGHLDRRWEAVFAGFSIDHRLSPGGQPVTVMRGPVVDQAALFGLLSRIRDLGVTLISLHPAEPGGGRPG